MTTAHFDKAACTHNMKLATGVLHRKFPAGTSASVTGRDVSDDGDWSEPYGIAVFDDVIDSRGRIACDSNPGKESDRQDVRFVIFA